MIWLTWRQHRAEAAVALLLVGCLGIGLIVAGQPMRVSFLHDGVAACLTRTDQSCAPVIEHFRNTFDNLRSVLILLNLVPVAIGAFLGAPLLAREFEAGTWQLAWTQAVPRRRWLAVKLVVLATVTVGLNLAMAAVVTWYRQPWDALDGRFAPDGFDLEGLMPPAYALFAFAVGTAAGTLIRRSVPALAVAFASFVAVRYTVESLLRRHYRTPVTAVWDPVTQGGTVGRDAWGLDYGIVDAQGHHLDGLYAYQDIYRAALGAHTDMPHYLHDHSMKLWDTYQPGDRFWTFQLIEAGLYLALVAALLTVVTWRVRHRTG
jgi:hypothetical protein